MLVFFISHQPNLIHFSYMAPLDLVTSVPDRSALSAGLGRFLTLKKSFFIISSEIQIWGALDAQCASEHCSSMWGNWCEELLFIADSMHRCICPWLSSWLVPARWSLIDRINSCRQSFHLWFLQDNCKCMVKVLVFWCLESVAPFA